MQPLMGWSLRDKVSARVPIVGGASAGGNRSQLCRQFANSRVFTDAIVAARITTALPFCSSIGKGLYETKQFLRVKHLADDRRTVTAFAEGCPSQILLRRLPWHNMYKNAPIATEPDEPEDRAKRALFQRMAAMMQNGWQHLPYKEKRKLCLDALERAFDQINLQPELARHQYKVSRLAQALGIDEKTFHTRWKNADLPPLKPAK